MDDPVVGGVMIESSEIPIFSVDVVLHRVELVQELNKKQKSEVMQHLLNSSSFLI